MTTFIILWGFPRRRQLPLPRISQRILYLTWVLIDLSFLVDYAYNDVQ